VDQDGAEAIRRLLSGLARGDDVFDLAAAIEQLHPRHNTFLGEVEPNGHRFDATVAAGHLFPSWDWQQAGACGAGG
jgi:hypothetical protein